MLKSLTLAATLGLSLASFDPCPQGESTRFKWQWKENYARKKIGSFKLKRRNLENEVTKKANKGTISMPDYINNGWTIILNFDKPVSHGHFHLNQGYDLSTNMAGNAIAFHSHPWNKELLEQKRNWFEILFDFEDDHEDFDLISVEVLEGEYANVQCRFGDDDFDVLGVMDSVSGNIVSHLDALTTITPVYNGVLPYTCEGSQVSLTECTCDNGTGETLADCINAVCIACDDGYDLIDSDPANAFCQDNSITAAQDEVNSRLDDAGAAKCASLDCLGITIMWDNTVTTNDLDIYVYTPTGNRIYYSQKSSDGGVLDIDARESTASPIENVIFENGAPDGDYRIEVENYQANHSGTKDFILALQKPGESTRTIYNFQMSGTSKEVIEVANFSLSSV